MTFSAMQSKFFRLLPFILVMVVAMAFVWNYQETEEAPTLPAPIVDKKSLDVRTDERWDFELQDLAGDTVRLSDFDGKVVVMNFFATWCPPCKDEMPSFERLYQRNKNKQFTVLGIAADPEGAKTVAPFAKETGVTFPVLLDIKNEVFSRYFVHNIPVTYVLDTHGRVASMFRGEADWSSPQAQEIVDYLLQTP